MLLCVLDPIHGALSTHLNAAPGLLPVQVQSGLKVVCVVCGVLSITSMLCFSTVAGWLAMLLCVLDPIHGDCQRYLNAAPGLLPVQVQSGLKVVCVVCGVRR